jgi:hypothetical protein
VLAQQRKNWQSKRRGFAGAGLGGADQIFSGKNNRKRAKLDRRWLRESHGLRPTHHLGQKSETIK